MVELKILSFNRTVLDLINVQIREILYKVCEMNRQLVCISFEDIKMIVNLS